jgi:hypothetical protein
MEISVRACDDVEALEYLRDPSVIKLLSVDPQGLSSDWITLVMDEKLLVVAKPEGSELEIHVACKFRDRGAVRETMKQGLEWLHSQGFSTVWTTAPDERKALGKMLEFLQFRKVGERWEHGY